MSAIEKAVGATFEKFEEQQAFGLLTNVLTGQAPTNNGLGGMLAGGLGLGGMGLGGIGGISGISGLNGLVGNGTTAGANGPASSSLLPFIQQAANATTSTAEKENLLATHLLQRMAAAAAPIAGTTVAAAPAQLAAGTSVQPWAGTSL